MARSSPSPTPVVLVVEDEPLLRLYAVGVLEDAGFTVADAVNSEAALKILELRPDVRLLFTDIQLPGGPDGMDLAREVHERWPNVRLVITSGRSRPEQAEIPNDGHFIAKPYLPSELVREVGDLLQEIDHV
jgi:CheY-like chemotaxis protein